jgi:hypothetical protein
MRVLLDECLPKKLKREVEADEVKTVPEVGWAIKRMETFCDAQGLVVGQKHIGCRSLPLAVTSHSSFAQITSIVRNHETEDHRSRSRRGRLLG